MASGFSDSNNFKSSVHYGFMLLLIFGCFYSMISVFNLGTKVKDFEDEKATFMTEGNLLILIFTTTRYACQLGNKHDYRY